MKKHLVATAGLIILAVSTGGLANPFISKKEISTPTAPAPIGVYSQAIEFNNMVYISGQIPIDPKTGDIVAGDFDAQVDQVLKNISEVAKAAGGNLDNIVKLNVYLTDLKNFNLVNEAMKKYFHAPYPARSAIEIKALPKNAVVEIEAVMGLGQ
jgi:2-iminobutanoate/2-iminopropanoate deaminase